MEYHVAFYCWEEIKAWEAFRVNARALQDFRYVRLFVSFRHCLWHSLFLHLFLFLTLIRSSLSPSSISLSCSTSLSPSVHAHSRKSGDNNAATVNNGWIHYFNSQCICLICLLSFLVNVLNYNKKWINSTVHILMAMNLFVRIEYMCVPNTNECGSNERHTVKNNEYARRTRKICSKQITACVCV